jgi:hypothetical protein
MGAVGSKRTYASVRPVAVKPFTARVTSICRKVLERAGMSIALAVCFRAAKRAHFARWELVCARYRVGDT